MNTIITIGRQFGSAGKEIGEKVAKYYGIKCLDKELLSLAAKESGFCQEMIESHDERPTKSFLYNLVMDTYSFGYNPFIPLFLSVINLHLCLYILQIIIHIDSFQ